MGTIISELAPILSTIIFDKICVLTKGISRRPFGTTCLRAIGINFQDQYSFVLPRFLKNYVTDAYWCQLSGRFPNT